MTDFLFFFLIALKWTASTKSLGLSHLFIFPPPPLSGAIFYRLQTWKQKVVNTGKQKYFLIPLQCEFLYLVHFYILGILTTQVYSVTSMCSRGSNYRLCCPNAFQCQTLSYHRCTSKYSSVLDFAPPLCKVGRRTTFPGRLRKKRDKYIYIAAAVQRLQEAWHAPVCPAEVADSAEIRPFITWTHRSSQGSCHQAQLKLFVQSKKLLNKH